MNTNAVETIHKEDIALLNRLTKILEEQVNVLQKSDINGRRIEVLNEQAQRLVDKISEKGLLELEELIHYREQIKRLYDNLNMAIIARKNETQKQVQHIRKGKKTLETYSSNI